MIAAPQSLIDCERYPITNLDAPHVRALIAAQRRSLAQRGVAILPGFVRAHDTAAMVEEALTLRPKAHLEDLWGTPYLDVPDESFPPGHPRRHLEHSLTWVIAYDVIPRSARVRQLYEWNPLMELIGEILERRPLYRMADPLGALNVTIMEDGHQQGWHYDNTEFVVSLALQSSTAGGKFECAPFIRSSSAENYDAVSGVLREDSSQRVEVVPMTPGTLMIFAGRNSIHRVSKVHGEVPRLVGLFAYDTRPDTDSSAVFKMLRYGRSEALPPQD